MPKPSVTCPGCKKHRAGEDSQFWPFCSKRCKMLDLGDWAAERFKIEVQSAQTLEEEDSEA